MTELVFNTAMQEIYVVDDIDGLPEAQITITGEGKIIDSYDWWKIVGEDLVD